MNRGGSPQDARETALYLTAFGRREIYGVGLGLTPEFALERLRAREEQVSATAGGAVRHNLHRHGIELMKAVDPSSCA